MSNILRVPAATAGSVPAAGTDYQKQNDSILRLVIAGRNAFPIDFTGNNVVKGASFNVGGVFYYASANEPITGTPSNYVKLTPISAGAQCSAAYVANLTGVTWSDTYNEYTDGSGNTYLFDEAKAFAAGAITVPKTYAGRAWLNVPHGRTVFGSGSGNYTVPSGVYSLRVTLVGGGGGGGNGTVSAAGGGGASGAETVSVVAVTPGQSIAYSVSGSGSGAGGSSTFAGATTATGGVAGTNGSGTIGGRGGTPSSVGFTGGGGQSGADGIGGHGGGRAGGVGGHPSFSTGNGGNGSLGGGGGGGSGNSGLGGNGGAGVLIVEW